jgi:hypothetical protein
MSDFGQIVDPYRVSPAQGNIQDYGMFAQRAEQTDAMRVAAALAAATRQYLAQQNGLPQGVDPSAVQGYRGEDQRQLVVGEGNQRANAMEGRQAQEFQEKRDYAERFIGGLPQQTDPLLGAAQQAGGVYGADLLQQMLGGQFGRQGALDNRTAMNTADNAAAQQRLETELRMKNQASVAEQARLDEVRKRQQGEAYDAFSEFKRTGDPAALAKIDPNLLTNPIIYDMMEQYKTEAGASAEAERKAKILEANPPPPSPVGSIQNKNFTAEQQRQIMQARVDRARGDRTLEYYAQLVAQDSQGLFASATPVNDMKTLYPEVYNAAWNKMQQEKQNKQFNQELEKTQNPLGYYIKKMLSGAGSVKG